MSKTESINEKVLESQAFKVAAKNAKEVLKAALMPCPFITRRQASKWRRGTGYVHHLLPLSPGANSDRVLAALGVRTDFPPRSHKRRKA